MDRPTTDDPITDEFVDELLLDDASDFIKSELERFEKNVIPNGVSEAQRTMMRMAFLMGAKQATCDPRQPVVIDLEDRDNFMQIVAYFFALLSEEERFMVLRQTENPEST